MADSGRNHPFSELLNSVSSNYARSEIVDILDVCLRNTVPHNNYTININNNTPDPSPPNLQNPSTHSNITSAIDGIVHTIMNDVTNSQSTGVPRTHEQNTYEVVISDSTNPTGSSEELQEMMTQMFSNTSSLPTSNTITPPSEPTV
jgi:hypothetical protein